MDKDITIVWLFRMGFYDTYDYLMSGQPDRPDDTMDIEYWIRKAKDLHDR